MAEDRMNVAPEMPHRLQATHEQLQQQLTQLRQEFQEMPSKAELTGPLLQFGAAANGVSDVNDMNNANDASDVNDAEVSELRQELSAQAVQLQEQRATLHELLDSSQVLGEAALKGEDKVNFLQQELIRMRASLDQEEEDAQILQEANTGLRSALEQVAQLSEPAASVAAPVPALVEHGAGTGVREVQARAMPPRSPATRSPQRPPRSPPATSRKAAPAPWGPALPDLGDFCAEEEQKTQGLEVLLAERDQKILAFEAEVAGSTRTQREEAEVGVERFGGEGHGKELQAWQIRLQKERREAAALAIRALAAKLELQVPGSSPVDSFVSAHGGVIIHAQAD
ncbi:unnamed protein product [Effrenium voratum]|nr:unnamed protein product [Effrenium voratum]